MIVNSAAKHDVHPAIVSHSPAWNPGNLAEYDEIRTCGEWFLVVGVGVVGVELATTSGSRPATWDEITGRRRDGMQLDTPDCTAWPVEDAWRVALWQYIARRAEDDPSGDDAVTCRRSLRVALGLDPDAGMPEVLACLPDAADTAAVRALALASLAIHDRLTAGEHLGDIVATTTPVPTNPAWQIPAGTEAQDRRVGDLQPGDLVAGTWDHCGRRNLSRGVAGPVTAAPTVQDLGEHGTWATVGIEGHEIELAASTVCAVYLTGTW